MGGADRTAPRRRTAAAAGAAIALVISLIGGALVLIFSGHPQQPAGALKPIQPSAQTPAEPTAEPAAQGLPSLYGDLASPDAGTSPGLPADRAMSLPDSTGGAALPALQLPPPPQLPPLPPPPQLPPPPDWSTLLQPYIDAQNNATAANIAGSVTGSTVGAGSAALNAAVVAAGDLILYAAYTNDGSALLSRLQSALSGLSSTGPALSQQLSPPDFSGLSAAFASMAAASPAGGMAPPQLPPPPQLPAPEQFAALAAVPLALSGLPPPPPIGLPAPPPLFSLPPPPPLPLPSITRLFGLPF